jgi:hypothetical protein
MGWFFRKSVGVGPFRVNLSKSGIGYSVGVSGARVGVGPRGTYVRLGRDGVYYQKYLNSGSPIGRSNAPIPTALNLESATSIATADVSQLHDSTSEHLLREIQLKHSSTRLAPFAVVLSIGLVLCLLVLKLPLWLVLGVIPVLMLVHYYLALRDYERKLVVLNYGLDVEVRKEYVALLNAVNAFADSGAIWRVTSAERFVNRKYHGGAATLLGRKRISLQLSAPPWMETDTAVWAMLLRDQVLYFFPDRILVYQGTQVGAVAYRELFVAVGQTRFVESDSVPVDAQIVDHTWQFVNKDGGPDRRFASNRRIPVVLYAQLTLQTQSGLNIALESSNLQKAVVLKTVLDYYVGRRRGT